MIPTFLNTPADDSLWGKQWYISSFPKLNRLKSDEYMTCFLHVYCNNFLLPMYFQEHSSEIPLEKYYIDLCTIFIDDN